MSPTKYALKSPGHNIEQDTYALDLYNLKHLFLNTNIKLTFNFTFFQFWIEQLHCVMMVVIGMVVVTRNYDIDSI